MSVSFLNDRLHFVLAIQPSKNVGRNKATQAQRVVAFPAFRALQMPETLYSLTLIKSYSGLQLRSHASTSFKTVRFARNAIKLNVDN